MRKNHKQTIIGDQRLLGCKLKVTKNERKQGFLVWLDTSVYSTALSIQLVL